MSSRTSSPTALSIQPSSGLLSFTSRSQDAQRYRVLRSIGGAAPQTVLETAATSRLKLSAPLCTPVTFTVVAVERPDGVDVRPLGGGRIPSAPIDEPELLRGAARPRPRTRATLAARPAARELDSQCSR